MVKAKAKISEKALDVLKPTKKAGSSGPSSSEPKTQSVRARSRSRSRTPGRPPKTPKVSAAATPPPKAKKAPRVKKAPKRLGQTPVVVAEKNTKAKAPAGTKKGRGRPTNQSLVEEGRIPRASKSRARATPKPKGQKTPTRASARVSTANSSHATANSIRNKLFIDEPDLSISGSRGNLSISSNTSSSGGWFSKCSIV